MSKFFINRPIFAWVIGSAMRAHHWDVAMIQAKIGG